MINNQFFIDKIDSKRGFGLFTKKGYRNGEKIGTYGKYRDAFEECDEQEIYFAPYHRGLLDFVETVLGPYINHSKEPNVDIRPEGRTWTFYANQDINPYDELTTNYSFVAELFPHQVGIPEDEGYRYNLKKLYNF